MFFFQKACYGTLIKLNLAGGVDVTANVLIKLAGQGNICVRILIRMDESDDENTDDVLSCPAFFSTSSNNSTLPAQLLNESSHVTHHSSACPSGSSSFAKDSNHV